MLSQNPLTKPAMDLPIGWSSVHARRQRAAYEGHSCDFLCHCSYRLLRKFLERAASSWQRETSSWLRTRIADEVLDDLAQGAEVLSIEERSYGCQLEIGGAGISKRILVFSE